MLRVRGGFAMRIASPLSELVVETEDDELIMECAARCRGRERCLSPSTRAYYEWLRNAPVGELRLAKQS